MPGKDADEDDSYQPPGLENWMAAAAPKNEEEALRARHYGQEVMLRSVGALYLILGIRLALVLWLGFQETGRFPATSHGADGGAVPLAAAGVCLISGLGLYDLRNWARHLALLLPLLLGFLSPPLLVAGLALLLLLETRGAAVVCSAAYRRIMPLTPRIAWWHRPKLIGCWLAGILAALGILLF